MNDGQSQKIAWGLDYRNVSIEGFRGWMLTCTRLSDGRMLACWHSAHRPQVQEVRKILARGLLHHEWPSVIWVDTWLSNFAAAECKKYGIRMHIRTAKHEGLESESDTYAARLDRAIGRPAAPTSPTSAMRALCVPASLKRIQRHWVN